MGFIYSLSIARALTKEEFKLKTYLQKTKHSKLKHGRDFSQGEQRCGLHSARIGVSGLSEDVDVADCKYDRSKIPNSRREQCGRLSSEPAFGKKSDDLVERQPQIGSSGTTVSYADIEQLRQQGCWDTPCMDDAPVVITRLPELAGRPLVIENVGGRPYFWAYNGVALDGVEYTRLSSSARAKSVRIAYCPLNSVPHYNATVNGARVDIPADGNCFFRSVATSLNRSLASDSAAFALRQGTANEFECLLDEKLDDELMLVNSSEEFLEVFRQSPLYEPFRHLRLNSDEIHAPYPKFQQSCAPRRSRRNAVSTAMHMLLLLQRLQPTGATYPLQSKGELNEIGWTVDTGTRRTGFLSRLNQCKEDEHLKGENRYKTIAPGPSKLQENLSDPPFKHVSSSATLPEEEEFLKLAKTVSPSLVIYRNALRRYGTIIALGATGAFLFMNGAQNTWNGIANIMKVKKAGNTPEYLPTQNSQSQSANDVKTLKAWLDFIKRQPPQAAKILQSRIGANVRRTTNRLPYPYYLSRAYLLLDHTLIRGFMTIPQEIQSEYITTKENLIDEIRQCNSTTSKRLYHELQKRSRYERNLEEAYVLFSERSKTDVLRSVAGPEITGHVSGEQGVGRSALAENATFILPLEMRSILDVANYTIPRMKPLDMRTLVDARREETRINHVADVIEKHRLSSPRYQLDRYALDLSRLHRAEQYFFLQEKIKLEAELDVTLSFVALITDSLTVSRMLAATVYKRRFNASSSQANDDPHKQWDEVYDSASSVYKSEDAIAKEELYRLELLCHCLYQEQRGELPQDVTTFWEMQRYYEDELASRKEVREQSEKFQGIMEAKRSFEFNTLEEYYNQFDEIRRNLIPYARHVANSYLNDGLNGLHRLDDKTALKEVLWINMGRHSDIAGILAVVTLHSGKIIVCSTFELNIVCKDVTDKVGTVYQKLRELGHQYGRDHKIEMANNFRSAADIAEFLLGEDAPSVFRNGSNKWEPGTLAKFVTDYWYVNDHAPAKYMRDAVDIRDILSKSIGYELSKLVDLAEVSFRDRHWYEHVLRLLPFFDLIEGLHAGRTGRVGTLEIILETYGLVTSLFSLGVKIGRLSAISADIIKKIGQKSIVNGKLVPSVLARQLQKELLKGSFIRPALKVNLEIAEFLIPPVALARPIYAAGRLGYQTVLAKKARKVAHASKNPVEKNLLNKLGNRVHGTAGCRGRRAIDSNGCFVSPAVTKKVQNIVHIHTGERLKTMTSADLFGHGFTKGDLEKAISAEFGPYLKSQGIQLDVTVSPPAHVAEIAERNYEAGDLLKNRAGRPEPARQSTSSDQPVAVTEMSGSNKGKIHFSEGMKEFYLDRETFDTDKIAFTLIHESIHSVAYRNGGGFDMRKMTAILGQAPPAYENLDEIFTDYFARQVANRLGIPDEKIKTGYFVHFAAFQPEQNELVGEERWYGAFAELVKDKLFRKNGNDQEWNLLIRAFFNGEIDPFIKVFSDNPEIRHTWKRYATQLEVRRVSGGGTIKKLEKNSEGKIRKYPVTVKFEPRK